MNLKFSLKRNVLFLIYITAKKSNKEREEKKREVGRKKNREKKGRDM